MNPENPSDDSNQYQPPPPYNPGGNDQWGQTSNFGQPGQAPGGYPGQPQYGMRMKHPQSTTALVLGILSIVLCSFAAPFAWAIGNKAVREIDANPAQYEGRSEANIGRILGIVGTVLLIIGVVVLILVFGLGVWSISSLESSGGYSNT